MFCEILSFSQEAMFYIQIEDPQIIPEFKRNEGTGLLDVSQNSAELYDIYSNYHIRKFELAFPTAITPSLQNVYYVECDEKGLGNELHSLYNEKIPRIGYIDFPPVSTYTPNDYGYAGSQSNLDLVKAKDAWDIAKDLPKIDVAVSDNYFDLNHEDLSMTLVSGSNTLPGVNTNHGTGVAGCVGTITDNSTGLSSIAFDADLAVASVRNDNQVLLLAQAGYRVINCSWMYGCTYNSIVEELYEEIRDYWGAIVVFGAGNANTHHCGNNNPSYPASYDSNIAVTSVGHINDIGTPGSPANNWKDVHEEIIGDSLSAHKHHHTIDICAPGYNVKSSTRTGYGPGGGNYSGFWGTSFAAPQVAGALCLIISVNPCLSADQAVAILLDNADSGIYSISENAQYIGRLGTGRLDVKEAVEAAAESGTIYLEDQTLSSSQSTESQYGIAFENVTITSGSHTFKTRDNVQINGPFQINSGVTCTFDVATDNVIACN